MRKYLYSNEVMARGSEFAEILIKNGYEAYADPDSVRDYMIKIAVKKNKKEAGFIRIYYKPSKGKYTIDFTEYNGKDDAGEIECLWSGKSIHNGKSVIDEKTNESSEYCAYVDGSFIDGLIGYGAVIIAEDRVISEIKGRVKNPEAVEQRQIPGEIEAVKSVVKWCKKNKVDSISIYYDYAGLEKWAKGEWKTNTKITSSYAVFMKKCSIAIEWKKVKSHSGDRWNEHADRLAKAGILE
jgi:ribonuclease HI